MPDTYIDIIYSGSPIYVEIVTPVLQAQSGGSVETVNDVEPDEDGNVELEGVDVLGYVAEDVENKDESGGYVGLTLFKINFKNVLNTFLSYFTNSNTASRTYTFQDRDGTIADLADLALKADLQSTLLSGGTTSVVGGGTTLRVAPATWYLLTFGQFSTLINTDYTGTVFCSLGTQRYVDIYGNNAGALVKVEGTEGAVAAHPSAPANSVIIASFLVGDSSASTTPDLSGYMQKSSKSSQSTNKTGTNDDTYVTPLANAVKALAPVPKAAVVASQSHFYSSIFISNPAENFTPSVTTTRGNPFFIDRPKTLNSLAIRCAAPATAGTLGRFAIYNDLNGAPYQKLWEGVNFGIDVTATVIVNGIGLALTPGMYWVMFQASASSGTIRTTTNGVSGHLLGFNLNASSATAYNGISYAGQTFASVFPADFSLQTPSGYTTGTSCPAIYIGYL